jgi:hypothetical protein
MAQLHDVQTATVDPVAGGVQARHPSCPVKVLTAVVEPHDAHAVPAKK